MTSFIQFPFETEITAMKPATALHHLSTLLTILLTSISTAVQQTPPPSSPAPGGCADSVISFSPCLPYISAPPNDLSDAPSSQCCDIFTAAVDSDEADCLCYLVRQNSLLGFPLNVTKLLSLSDLCEVGNSSQMNDTANSLDSICSGSPTLPPLMATPKTPPSGSNANAPPPPIPTALHHTPPSTVTKPRPPANNEFRQNITKPSTPQRSNDLGLANAAGYIWCLFLQLVYFIVERNIVD